MVCYGFPLEFYGDCLTEHKLHEHVESAVRHREPNIQKLAKTYNKLCDDLEQLIRAGKAPQGAIVP